MLSIKKKFNLLVLLLVVETAIFINTIYFVLEQILCSIDCFDVIASDVMGPTHAMAEQ